MSGPSDAVEGVEQFRLRCRGWLAASMPTKPTGSVDTSWARQRDLQALLWRGRFAGIRFPRAYGGLGLTEAHRQAFNEESVPYELPVRLNVPNFGILAATLLDCGTEAQKRRHIPKILAGDEIWVQFLSEPSGGSDLAGSLTRADRDGDIWVLNGSKIWSSGAMDADCAMCLARTNWDVPKHRGLTMFIVKIHQPSIRVEPIRQVNGSTEFCQEFFDDVTLDSDAVVGEVDGGWSVALRLLAHERVAAGGGSPFASGTQVEAEPRRKHHPFVRSSEFSDPAAREDLRQGVAEEKVLDIVGDALVKMVTHGLQSGTLDAPAGALLKLFSGLKAAARAEAALAVSGTSAVVWRSDDPNYRSAGEEFLTRQTGAIAGGTNEMQRNIVAERLLGMPREWAADRDVPFREVRTNRLRP